jgi:hypothetical protein
MDQLLARQAEPVGRRFGRRSRFGLTLAAGLLLVGALVGVFIVSLNPSPTISGHRAVSTNSVPIATLTSIDAQVTGDEPILAGQPFAAQTVHNQTGESEFVLTSGVLITMSGSTSLRMQSPMDATILSGRITIYCPPQARGFAVVLPSGDRVVDIGTRFSVEVDPRGAARIVVLEGEVELHALARGTAPPGIHRFTVGQYAEVSETEARVFSAVANPGGVWNAVQRDVPSQATTIGWNFVLNSQSTNGQLAATDVAGAPGFAQSNWNNHPGIGQGPGAVPLALVDHSGAPSGVSISAWTQETNNSWRMGQAPSTADDRLMHTYASNDPKLTFEGLDAFAPDGYTVVVYYGRGGDSALTADFTVNGVLQTVSYRKTESAYVVQDAYLLNGADGVDESNYAVFESLSGNVLTITQDTGNANNFGITGLQIRRMLPALEPGGVEPTARQQPTSSNATGTPVP